MEMYETAFGLILNAGNSKSKSMMAIEEARDYNFAEAEALIKEAREDEDEELNASFDVKTMLALAVATSIDALAVGVTFAFLHVNIVWAVTFIGCTTFILSAIGVKVGNVFGMKYKSKAEFVGGLILVLMGIKILLEHLGFLG